MNASVIFVRAYPRVSAFCRGNDVEMFLMSVAFAHACEIRIKIPILSLIFKNSTIPAYYWIERKKEKDGQNNE